MTFNYNMCSHLNKLNCYITLAANNMWSVWRTKGLSCSISNNSQNKIKIALKIKIYNIIINNQYTQNNLLLNLWKIKYYW